MSIDINTQKRFPTALVSGDCGEPPARWIREQRLDRAHRMLQDSSLSVSEVAYTLGFENATHFSRIFKQRYGVSPSAV